MPTSQISAGMPAEDTFSVRENDPCRPTLRPSRALPDARQNARPCKRDADGSPRGEPDDSPSVRVPPVDGSRARPAAAPGKGGILLLGTDTILLRSRRDILEHFSYQVTYQVIDNSSALPPLAGIVLVHLCQTLSPQHAARLARRIRAAEPGVTLLYTETLRQPESQEFDRLLPPLLHPTAYVKAVSGLLRNRA